MSPVPRIHNRIIDDPELIVRLQRGDEWTLQLLIRRFREQIFAIALGITLDREVAQDVVREALVQGYHSIRTLNREISLAVWLHRITVNCCLKSPRWSWNRPPAGRSPAVSPTDAGSPSIDEILGHLLPRDRAIFSLKAVERFSEDEIAELSGVPVQTIKNRLFIIWDRIIRLLKPDDAGNLLVLSDNRCGPDRLVRYLDGVLFSTEKEDLLTHFMQCDSCRYQFETMNACVRDWGQWMEGETRSVDFKTIEKTVVLQALCHRHQNRRKLLGHIVKMLILILVMAGILTAGVWFLI